MRVPAFGTAGICPEKQIISPHGWCVCPLLVLRKNQSRSLTALHSMRTVMWTRLSRCCIEGVVMMIPPFYFDFTIFPHVHYPHFIIFLFRQRLSELEHPYRRPVSQGHSSILILFGSHETKGKGNNRYSPRGKPGSQPGTVT